MKETGMVRRLDDLGRLVIPKEIRKMYKMKEGDSIEIYIKDDIVCIRKYDSTSPFYEQIYYMCQILRRKYEGFIFFTSDEFMEKEHLQIEERMLEKCRVHRTTSFENAKVFKNDEARFKGFIFPIVSDGNYYGSLVFVESKKSYALEELSSIQMFSELLSYQQHS